MHTCILKSYFNIGLRRAVKKKKAHHKRVAIKCALTIVEDLFEIKCCCLKTKILHIKKSVDEVNRYLKKIQY